MKKHSWKMRATSSSSGGMIADRAELLRGLRLIADPKSGCEIVALPSGKFTNLASMDIDGLAVAVDGMPNGIGIYIRLNPVTIGLNRCARKADIIGRRWLYIDIDPIKPESEKDNPATDDEKDGTRQVGESVNEYLAAQGWPAPIVLDSGNGCALLYRIELEANAGIQSLYRKFLLSLQTRFHDQPGIIDGSVHDATRLIKLPGTWAKKGQCSDDRPYRPARIVFAPVDSIAVTAEMIASVCDEKIEHQPAPNAFTARVGGDGSNAYARAALDGECARVAMGRPNNRNNDLNRAAFSLGQLIGAGALTLAECEARLTEEALRAGLGASEIRSTIASGMNAGIKEPRKMPESRAEQPKIPAAAAVNGSIIEWASSIVPRQVEWLWPGRVPLGKLTTFAGVGGLGKTFVLCDIAARVSAGMEWPDKSGFAKRGRVLFISGEDEPDDTLVPRMIEQNADLSRIAFLRTEVQDRFTLADLVTLEKAIEQMSEVRFVAIDPPTAYLGGVNDHNNAELRQLLTPLKSWAAKNSLALIFNTHVRKPSGSKIEAMMQVMGSVAWVNAVRAAHMFVRDPADPERRLFVGMKNNLGKEIKGLAYRLAAVGSLAKVEWLGEVDTTADEAMNTQTQKEKRGMAASEWLIGKFREKLEWESEKLFEAAKHEGISRNAIWEAKKELDLPRAKRHVYENGDVSWLWCVPSDWQAFGGDVPKDEIATVPDLI